MKQIFRYIRPFTGRMCLGLAIKIIGTLMDLALPWMLAYMLDTVVPAGSRSNIILLGLLMLLAAVIGISGNIVANRIASAVARDTTRAIRRDLFARCMSLSCTQVDKIGIPSLETRLTGDTYNIHQMVGMMQRMGVRAPILLIGGICCAFAMEPALALVMLAVLPFISAAVYFISKRGRQLYREVQLAADSMVRKVRQISKGIRVIKAFSTQPAEESYFESLNRGLSDKEQRAGIIMGASNPIMTVLLNLGLIAVILTGAFLVNAGVSQSGKIIAFMSYFTIISNAMLVVTRMFIMYSKSSASAQRINQVLDTPEDLEQLEDNTVYTQSFISFQNVSFAYGGTPCLQDVSFELEEGQTLGIVGATGSGKSTVIKLLLRLYDCSSGRICLCGRDVRSYKSDELHSFFAAVMQNDFIFTGTVLENVRFGRDIPQSDVTDALKKAKADFVFSDPMGIEKHITAKGTNISGGQRQRLLIARALAGKPRVLVLDDSSSALDYATDAAIRGGLAKENMTKIIIAQRISSVMNADKILVMDAGRVIACGTHEQLLDSCAIYKEISLSQIGGAVLE